MAHPQKSHANSLMWRLTRQSLLMRLETAFMEHPSIMATEGCYTEQQCEQSEKRLLFAWIKENCSRMWHFFLQTILKSILPCFSLVKIVLLKRTVHTSCTSTTRIIVVEWTNSITSWRLIKSQLGIVQVDLRSEVSCFCKWNNLPRNIMSFIVWSPFTHATNHFPWRMFFFSALGSSKQIYTHVYPRLLLLHTEYCSMYQ